MPSVFLLIRYIRNNCNGEGVEEGEAGDVLHNLFTRPDAVRTHSSSSNVASSPRETIRTIRDGRGVGGGEGGGGGETQDGHLDFHTAPEL